MSPPPVGFPHRGTDDKRWHGMTMPIPEVCWFSWDDVYWWVSLDGLWHWVCNIMEIENPTFTDTCPSYKAPCISVISIDFPATHVWWSTFYSMKNHQNPYNWCFLIMIKHGFWSWFNPPSQPSPSAMSPPHPKRDPSSSSFEGWRSCCNGADFGPAAMAAGDLQHLERFGGVFKDGPTAGPVPETNGGHLKALMLLFFCECSFDVDWF